MKLNLLRTSIYLLVLAIVQAGASLAWAAAADSRTSNPSADELVGLWKAKKRLGPDARGTLILKKERDEWSADFLGQILPVRSNGKKLELTHRDGAFTGELAHGGAIRGHWAQSKSLVDYGYAYATPVVLAPDGPGRWRGQVIPKDNTLTFFLKVEKRPSGSLGAFLRNPERNLGKQYDVDHLQLEGDAVKLIGKGENTALISGTYDAQKKVLFLEIPTIGDDLYLFTRDDDFSTFYPRGKTPGRYVYRPPLAGEDGWPVATLDEVNLDRAAIEKFIQMLIDMPIDSVSTPEVHSILAARHGKLVLEEYFHGEHRDKIHDDRSAGKSVVATLIAAAMQAGAPLKLSSPVYQVMNGGTFPSDLEPRKRTMTLEHLLMMRSGYFCDDSKPESPGNEVTIWAHSLDGSEPDTYQYTLRVPLDRDPGAVSIYCSGDPNLALGMLGRATGESQLDLFDRLIGDPLKIKYYAWNIDAANNPYGGGGVYLRARDFAKFGQLMLNGGTWGSRRILSRDFASRASASLHDLKRMKYGYLWWSYEFPYKNRTTYAYWAGGNGGQAIMVYPQLDLIITTFAGNYGDSVGLHISQDLTTNYMLPAVREKGDAPNAPIIEGKFSTPYGLPGVPNPK